MNAHSKEIEALPLALSNEQLRQFVTTGYLLLRSELPAEFHQQIFNKLEQLQGGSGHFGNNLMPLVPQLHQLIEEPVVRGALTSILGDEYSFHAHRALHTNPPGSTEQAWHKDSYWGYTRRVRNHRPWWAMLMYYPQNTKSAMGPTGLLAGSQYFHQLLPKQCKEVAAFGEAGTLLLIHYDLWHRKMLNNSKLDRYMIKFQFTRLLPPKKVTGVRPADWRRPRNRPNFDLNPIWKSTWDWLHGIEPTSGSGPTEFSATELEQALLGENEIISLNAAFKLSHSAQAGNGDALKILASAMNTNNADNDNTKRYSDNGARWRIDAAARSAAHGLANIGEPALPALRLLYKNGSPIARKHAAFALGEIGTLATQNTLLDGLNDPDIHVMISAVEALGLTPPTIKATKALIECLQHSESEVRFDAALSLLRFTANPACVLKGQMTAALSASLRDSNRYVSAYAAEALERLATKEALAALIPFLTKARWCAHTDNARPF